MDEAGVPQPAHRSQGDGQVARGLLYRSLFDHVLVQVHIWEVLRDERGKIATWRLVDANRAALKSWGQQLADVVGKTTDDIFPGAGASKTFMPVVEEIMSTGLPKEWEMDFVGTAQVLQMVSIPVGEYFVSTGFDVTADRLKERRLQETLLSLTQATQAGGVGLWDWDIRTHEVHYSDEYKRQLGYGPNEISNSFEEWRTRVHPEDLEATLNGVQSSIKNLDESFEVVFRMRHRDGSYRWILARSSLTLGEDGKPHRMLGAHMDITERRRLEERVAETQKLESIGTLAAGIAHDFNNLLGAITGNLSLLRETPPSDPEVPELLKELDEAAGRAQALTHQLLTFAKGGAPVREVASVRELVVDSARFVTRGSSSRCVFSIADDVATVEADVGQLSQVINNLVINATQSMPDGGLINVSAVNVALKDKNQWGLPKAPICRSPCRTRGSGFRSRSSRASSTRSSPPSLEGVGSGSRVPTRLCRGTAAGLPWSRRSGGARPSTSTCPHPVRRLSRVRRPMSFPGRAASS